MKLREFIPPLMLVLLTCSGLWGEKAPSYTPNDLSNLGRIKTQVKTIVIDPGHGGKDLGTHSSKTPPYKEKELNLVTARVLQKYLQKLGYRVLMTRSDDSFIDLADRAVFANDCRCDLFISVHYNSAPNTQASGIEVYFFQSKEKPQRAKASELLGQYILTGVIEQTQAKARGVRKGNFAVIRETTMPAVLIEGGFLTNETERDNILQATYRRKVALGVAQGIEHYFAAQKLAILEPTAKR